VTARLYRFPDAAQLATVQAARRLEAAARARHDCAAEHRAEFVRIAREAARDAIATRHR
jgi:hypothetical protein